jgi:hypothetical protein
MSGDAAGNNTHAGARNCGVLGRWLEGALYRVDAAGGLARVKRGAVSPLRQEDRSSDPHNATAT